MNERPKSFLYTILRPVVYVAARIFYRRWIVNGLENFPPKGTPVMIVSNHQNALIDPLLCCLTAPRQLHFLTRADVFRNALLRPLVLALNMLPVYRMRDQEAGKNERNMRTFNTVIARMQRGAAVGIFPEGNHGNKKIIRPLKKGLAQLLEITAEQAPELRDLLIIPVGVDYSNYDRARSSVVITYGEAFTVSDLLFTEEERLPRYRAVMQRVQDRMNSVALNLGPDKHYNFLLFAEALFIHAQGYANWQESHSATHLVKGSLQHQPPQDAQLFDDADELSNALQSKGVSFRDMEEVLTGDAPSVLRGMVLLIFGLPGLLLHFPAWQLSLAATRKVVIDPHFNSTFRLLFGLLLFGLTWSVGIAACFLLLPVKIATLVLISALISSIIALRLADDLLDRSRFKRVKDLFSSREELMSIRDRLKKEIESRLA